MYSGVASKSSTSGGGVSLFQLKYNSLRRRLKFPAYGHGKPSEGQLAWARDPKAKGHSTACLSTGVQLQSLR